MDLCELVVCDKIADVCTHPHASAAAESAGRHPDGSIEKLRGQEHVTQGPETNPPLPVRPRPSCTGRHGRKVQTQISSEIIRRLVRAAHGQRANVDADDLQKVVLLSHQLRKAGANLFHLLCALRDGHAVSDEGAYEVWQGLHQRVLQLDEELSQNDRIADGSEVGEISYDGRPAKGIESQVKPD